jgi:hypothetical protein
MDYLPPELARVLTTGTQELSRHVSDAGQQFQACGAPWPCPRAELAAVTSEAV